MISLPYEWDDIAVDGAIAPSEHRATHASHRAVLHRLGHSVGIAIAAFNVIYFGAQLLRGVL